MRGEEEGRMRVPLGVNLTRGTKGTGPPGVIGGEAVELLPVEEEEGEGEEEEEEEEEGVAAGSRLNWLT